MMHPKSASFTHTLMRWLYSCVLFLFLPLLLLLFKKKLHQAHPVLVKRSFLERFGYIPKQFKADGIHIHCVSVGEINAASGLIHALLTEFPHLPITLTTSSTTGAVHAFNVFKDKVQHCYLPIDLAIFMGPFYKRITPKIVLVTEVEIWPNMLANCAKKRVPVVLINARMTDKSLHNYKRLAWLFRPSMRQFSQICAQSSESFDNFLSYGVYKKQLKLSRNMKFDLLPEELDEARGQRFIKDFGLANRPIFLAGSTHDPEEKMVLEVYQQLKSEFVDLALIIVPRHPHRFNDVQLLIKATGLSSAQVSSTYDELGNAINKTSDRVDCVLVDTMGWLKACYSVCTLAFVGGSFAPKGGHNALEAAVYAKPIIMGPSVFNNPTICQYLVEQNALTIAHSQADLFNAAQHWLANPEYANLDGERGSRVLLRNAGSVEFTLGIVRSYIDNV